jgi:AcrR family transcriptional regulator
MAEPGSRRGRTHDAEGAREAILNAAEEVFAEHGFDGARVDRIAEVAGYNKSLIFQYFDDKLGLYSAMLKRADRETTQLQWGILGPMMANPDVLSDPKLFKEFLHTAIGLMFDYLIEQPNFTRIFLWEMAEGWQTYQKIAADFNADDTEPIMILMQKAYEKGLLRSKFVPLVQLTLLMQVGMSFIGFLPLYNMLLPDEDFTSPTGLKRGKEFIVEFVAAGLMSDPTPVM